MKRIVILLTLVFILTGCGSMGPGATARLATIFFTQVVAGEMELHGLAGPAISVKASIDIGGEILDLSELTSTTGKSFPMIVPDRSTPWIVLCQGDKNVEVCNRLAVNTPVTIWGKSAGIGNLFIAKRISIQ